MSTSQINQSNPALSSQTSEETTQAFYPSLFQSFFIIFLSEIADRTFILVLIYSMKMHWLPLLATSLGAMFCMNLLAIGVGYMVPLLLVRGIVDWIGFFCFLGFGIMNLYEGFHKESKTVVEEFNEEINENDHQYSRLRQGEHTNVTQTLSRTGKPAKVKGLGSLCFELFTFLLLSELGDKSQIATITIAAIYNIYGVIIGTTVAYLCTILIAGLIGHTVGKFITEKTMCIVGGFLFLAFALEILIIKLFF